MEVGDKYKLLMDTEYGNFKANDKAVVTNVMKFSATNTMFYTLQNVDDKNHVATFKFIGYKTLVLLG